MKILYLNHNRYNIGTFLRCFFLARGLSKKGHKMTILCTNSEKCSKVKYINRDGVNIILLPYLKHDFFWGHLWRVFIASFLIFRIKFQLLHSFAVSQPVTAVPTIIAKLFIRKPIIVDWDDFWGSKGISGLMEGDGIYKVRNYFFSNIHDFRLF